MRGRHCLRPGSQKKWGLVPRWQGLQFCVDTEAYTALKPWQWSHLASGHFLPLLSALVFLWSNLPCSIPLPTDLACPWTPSHLDQSGCQGRLCAQALSVSVCPADLSPNIVTLCPSLFCMVLKVIMQMEIKKRRRCTLELSNILSFSRHKKARM